MGPTPSRRLELNQGRRPGRRALPDGKRPLPALPPTAIRISSIPTLRPASLLPSYISSGQGGREILRFRVVVPNQGRAPDRFVWEIATSAVSRLAARPGRRAHAGTWEIRPSTPPNISPAAAPSLSLHLAAAGRPRPPSLPTGPPCTVAECGRRRGSPHRTSALQGQEEGSRAAEVSCSRGALRPKSRLWVATEPPPPPFYETPREAALGLHTML